MAFPGVLFILLGAAASLIAGVLEGTTGLDSSWLNVAGVAFMALGVFRAVAAVLLQKRPKKRFSFERETRALVRQQDLHVCPSCHFENESGSRHCERCGVPL